MWINEFYSQQRELPCLDPHNSSVESSGWLLWIHMLKHMISRHNDFLSMDEVIITPISTCSFHIQRIDCGCNNEHRTGRIRSRIYSLDMYGLFSDFTFISMRSIRINRGSQCVLWPHYGTRSFLPYLRTHNPWTNKDLMDLNNHG